MYFVHLLISRSLSNCCDWKAGATSVQSFTLWQQATTEFTRRDHSIIACSHHIYILLFFAHIPFVVNHTINTMPTERLQQHPLRFTMNRTDRTFYLWRLHTAQPLHPGHSTILLRLESPSGKCAKFSTMIASNNRVHMPWSLYYCLFVPHIYIYCCFSCTSCSWWITQSTQRQRRGCNSNHSPFHSTLWNFSKWPSCGVLLNPCNLRQLLESYVSLGHF